MGSENEQYIIVCKGDCGYRDGLSIMEIKWRRKGGSLERLLPFRNCCLFVVFYKLYYKEKITLEPEVKFICLLYTSDAADEARSEIYEL